MKIISEIIKRLRIKSGYTQKQVADLLGVDRSTYSYYELGRIKPDIKTIMSLSEIFKVHYTQILESETNYRFSDINNSKLNSQNTDNLIGNLSREEYNAFMAFKILPKDSKNEIVKLINEKFDNFRNVKRKERFDSYFK